RIREDLEIWTKPESQTAFVKGLDDLIATLNRLRDGLMATNAVENVADVQKAIGDVVKFLEVAKTDEAIKTLLLPVRKVATPKPKRTPVEIPANLTNEQIRQLLEKDLSVAELKAIAAQRAISVGKANASEIRQSILKNLERQEGYERL